MFGAFNRSGLLTSVTWTAKDGGTPDTKDVYFNTQDLDVDAGGSGAISREYSITYPIEYFVGMERSDLVTIGAVVYFVRSDPVQDDSNFMTARLGVRR